MNCTLKLTHHRCNIERSDEMIKERDRLIATTFGHCAHKSIYSLFNLSLFIFFFALEENKILVNIVSSFISLRNFNDVSQKLGTKNISVTVHRRPVLIAVLERDIFFSLN